MKILKDTQWKKEICRGRMRYRKRGKEKIKRGQRGKGRKKRYRGTERNRKDGKKKIGKERKVETETEKGTRNKRKGKEGGNKRENKSLRDKDITKR